MKKTTRKLKSLLIKAIQSEVLNGTPTLFIRKLPIGSTLIQSPVPEEYYSKKLLLCSVSRGMTLWITEEDQKLIEVGIYTGLHHLKITDLRELLNSILNEKERMPS
ncbi:MAG: hypothetical protein J6I84_03865 [Bacilli bacterium]|nr:hypothetical protein [Bacilli bacterium]